MRFARDVALTGGAQVALGLFTMISGIVVARVMGPAARGTLAVLVALGGVTVLLGSFGIHQSSVYFMGRRPEQRDAVISNTITVSVVGAILVVVALGGVGLLFRAQLIHGIATVLFLTYLPTVGIRYFNEFTRRIALGQARVALYNLPDLLEGISLLLGTPLVLFTLGHSLRGLVALRVGYELLIALLLGSALHRRLTFRFHLSGRLGWDQVRYGIRNYASSLLWVFLLQSDLVLCNFFLGAAPTGIYSVAVATGSPISILGAVVGVVLFQRSTSDQSRVTRIANTCRVMRLLSPIVLGSTLCLGVAAHWLIPAVYGARFAGASEALELLLPGLAAFALEIVLMNFLAGEGSPPIIYWGPLAGVMINLVANLFVIPRYGIDGAAVTSSIGYIVVLGLVGSYYVRSTGTAIRDLILVRREDVSALRAHD